MRRIVCLIALLALTLAMGGGVGAAELTVQSIVSTGITPSLTAAAALGDTFDNDGSTFYHIDNADGGNAHTLTFAAVATCSLGELHDVVVIVAGGDDAMIGPFPKHIYNDIAGEVAVTYDAVTSVTVGAIKL